MREIRVKAPAGEGARVAELALGLEGVERVGVYQEYVHGPGVTNDVVSVEASTPVATRLVDALLAAPFFEPGAYSLSVRELRAVVTRGDERDRTCPMPVPEADIAHDLWQFSHVTRGHVGRVAIASLMLAYGMQQGNLLTMIAGLLFLPMLPAALAVGLGLHDRRFGLAAQGLRSLGASVALVFAGGLAVGALVRQPVAYHGFSSLAVSLLVSAGVGAAGGLASADDVGRREMIGLAAASQFTLVPAWFGLSLVVGFDAPDKIGERLALPFLNGAVLIVASFLAYAALRLREPLRAKR